MRMFGNAVVRNCIFQGLASDSPRTYTINKSYDTHGLVTGIYDYIYKFGKEENQKDEIEDYKFELKENLNIFKDKLFMPLENNKAVNIPLIIGGEIKVIILDTENGEVTSFNNDK